jgi:hypothetical protein
MNCPSTSAANKERYFTLKDIVRQNIGATRKLWGALKAIKEEKLYRIEYDTWEQFCLGQHDLTPQHANFLIEAESLSSTLKPLVINKKSEENLHFLNTAQVRELKKLPPQEQSMVIDRVSEKGPVTTKAIKLHVAEKKSETKPASEEVVLDQVGFPVPKRVMELWKRRDEPYEWVLVLRKLHGVIEKAKKENDALWGSVVFSALLADLHNTAVGIKEAIPYAVCTSCQGQFAKSCMLCGGRGLISKFKFDTHVTQEQKDFRKRVAK